MIFIQNHDSSLPISLKHTLRYDNGGCVDKINSTLNFSANMRELNKTVLLWDADQIVIRKYDLLPNELTDWLDPVGARDACASRKVTAGYIAEHYGIKILLL